MILRSIKKRMPAIQNLSKKAKVALACLAGALVAFWFSLPDPLFRSPTSFVIEDEKGELLSASIAEDGQWRFPANDSIADKFSACILAFEDKRFRYHPGVDPLAFARAIKQNLAGGRTVSGGSTITMQVIRLSRKKPRTWWNKLIEMALAIRLELGYSKDEILNLYAANAPFGSNVIGLDAAAWRYYGRSAGRLSWGEMATLAVLPNAPSLVYPGKNRGRLIEKRNRLLDKLAAQTVVDASTAALAKLEPLPDRPLPLPQLAPHLLARFKKDHQRLRLQSTRIKTTVRSGLQQRVTAILERHHRQFRANGINNAAALVLEVETGEVLAYAGNIYHPDEPELESHVDMIPALRSPGSTLKPLLYASMLAEGMILPNTLIPDIPTQIGSYIPQNFDLGYDGAIPASKALSRSLNIPAVKMLQNYKYERFHQQLKKLGMTTLTKPAGFYGLSLILGGCETSMWELSGIYAGMARSLNLYNRTGKSDGRQLLPTYIKPERGEEKIGNEPATGNTNWNAASYFTFQAMQEVMRPGEELLWEQFASSQKIAWKTGTSFGFRDGWAIGLTPQYVVCIWVGNADGEGRTGLTGIETAAPVLFDVFDLLPRSNWFSAPADKLATTAVCRQSGYKAGMDCPNPDTVLIPAAGLRSATCPYHHTIHLDAAKQYQVTADCVPAEQLVNQPWFVLPPAMGYYYKLRHRDYAALPPYKPGCQDDEQLYRPLEMIYPKNNARVYIPVEIDGNRGKAIFNAAHRSAGTKIYWHLDNEYISTTTDFHQLALSPPPGKHLLTLVDEQGNRLVQRFVVLDAEKDADLQ